MKEINRERNKERNKEKNKEKKKEDETKSKQVTWGHNIVVDGWAGAANSHPHPTFTQPSFQHRYIHKKLLKRSSYHFSTCVHGRTDGPTDKASYRVACPQLKRMG